MQPSWRRTTELQSMSSSVDNVHTVARYVRICLCYLVLAKVTKACFERISIASPPSDDCNILHKFAHMTYYIYTYYILYIRRINSICIYILYILHNIIIKYNFRLYIYIIIYVYDMI